MIDWNKIINSSLVVSAYKMAKNDGFNASIHDIASMLLQEGIIDIDGEPTEKAVKEGLVSVRMTLNKKPNPVADFKAKYPVFNLLPDKHFKVIDGRVCISETGLKILGEKLNRDLLGELKEKFPDKY